MAQWEYKKIRLNDLSRKSDDIDLLCDAGEEGWELVVMLPNNIAYLKREFREEPDIGTRSAEDDADESRSEVKVKYRDAVTGDTWAAWPPGSSASRTPARTSKSTASRTVECRISERSAGIAALRAP